MGHGPSRKPAMGKYDHVVPGYTVGCWTVTGTEKRNRRWHYIVQCDCGVERSLQRWQIATLYNLATECNHDIRGLNSKGPNQRQAAESVGRLVDLARERVRADFRGVSEREAEAMAEVYLQRAIGVVREG